MKACYKIAIITLVYIAVGVNYDLAARARGQRCPCNKPQVAPKPVVPQPQPTQPDQAAPEDQLQQNNSDEIKRKRSVNDRCDDRCGCSAPAPAPVQQPKPLPAQPVVAVDGQPAEQEQVQSEGDVTKQMLVRQCCDMIEEEAQKVSDQCLSQELLQMAHMVANQECCRSSCQTDDLVPVALLLRECCVALQGEAEKNCDDCMMQQVETMLQCVNAIEEERTENKPMNP